MHKYLWVYSLRDFAGDSITMRAKMGRQLWQVASGKWAARAEDETNLHVLHIDRVSERV